MNLASVPDEALYDLVAVGGTAGELVGLSGRCQLRGRLGWLVLKPIEDYEKHSIGNSHVEKVVHTYVSFVK